MAQKGTKDANRHIYHRVRKPEGDLTVFCTNYIRTTKYTLITFLPQNLFEQFLKKANFYFLIIAILSTTSFSPKTPLVSIVPLVFVLAVTAVKEGLEDYRRYKSDVEVNNKMVEVWRGGRWQATPWAKVAVGDILKVIDGDAFPCDLLLLQSSARQGICNIETSNLDGETNLKVKQAVDASYNVRCADDGLDYPNKVKFTLETDTPNDKMDKTSFKGNLIGFNGAGAKIPVGMDQLCLRGCSLRNTKWIIGIACFTGRETKLMMQNKGKKIKRSKVDRTVDQALYIIFGIQFCLCVLGSIGYYMWMKDNAETHWYLPYVKDKINIKEEGGLAFFTYLVLLDLLVPISLYVSMELVKFAQAWFINQDITMYYEKHDIPATARTSNLNEELGQIEYIFSDKTGTLTRNEMEFLRCSVGGVAYGPGEMDIAGETPPRVAPKKGIPPFKPRYRFEDNRMINNLVNNHSSAKDLDHFLTVLSVCHTVIPEYPSADLAEQAREVGYCGVVPKYQAASPDELALVEAATDQQYYFFHREPVKFMFRGQEISGMRVRVNIMGKLWNFDVLEVLEFTSHRKRMSVLIVDPRDKKIKVLCKGADNVIRDLSSKKSVAHTWKPLEEHLNKFAGEGLRTLCCAYREVPGEEFDKWYRDHQKAKSSMANREGEIQASSAAIECEMTLLGATAIEDRLQEGVPEAIKQLAQAGMKIWVLTGDKTETAINIGRSCNLLTPRMRGDNLLVIDINEALEDGPAKAQTLAGLKHAHDFLKDLVPEEKEHVGIVISGKALGYVFPIRKLDKNKKEIIPPQHILDEEDRLQKKFLNICTQVKAVVCCRMSPKQKSQVVKLVREFTPYLTLAIGDGANDVAMIEAAHVGIGIEGLEGKQAVMSSDYSIGQFRFLTTLLLVHGAWSYRRLSMLILYCFYKNVTVTMVQIWFQLSTGYSGPIFYDAVSGALYNMIFTAFPILLAAIFNRDVSRKSLLKYPELYKTGPENAHFNIHKLMWYLLEGGYHSVILYYLTIYTLRVPSKSDGTDNDQWIMAVTMLTALMIVVNIRVALLTTTWTKYSKRAFWLTVASWFLWIVVYTSVQSFNPDTYWTFYRTVYTANFLFIILIAPVACLLPWFIYEFIRATYMFTRMDIIKEREAGLITGPDLEGLPTEAERERLLRKSGTSSEIEMGDATETGMSRENWRKIAAKTGGDDGFAPFVEDDAGDDFVMGQSDFLKKYMGKNGGSRQGSRTNLNRGRSEDDMKRRDDDDMQLMGVEDV